MDLLQDRAGGFGCIPQGDRRALRKAPAESVADVDPAAGGESGEGTSCNNKIMSPTSAR